MWVKTNFGGALLNSLYVSITATSAALILSIPAAYAMSRYRFAGKGLYKNFLLMTQMMSPIVLVLGLFRLMMTLGLVNDLNSLVITYAAFNMAFTIWMLQSYFNSIPRDLEEAAWMDGASHLTSLIRIFLPLAVPAIVVTAIFTFINSWNEFVLALTMMRSSEDFTLPVQIYSQVAGRYQVEWHHVMAGTVLATVPVAILFSWLQRYLIRGMALGAVK
jgi:multiple sugar transport system permease protein